MHVVHLCKAYLRISFTLLRDTVIKYCLPSRVELLDYLDSIDCSLEDFQAMLSGRQFSIDPDLLLVDVILTLSMLVKAVENTCMCCCCLEWI